MNHASITIKQNEPLRMNEDTIYWRPPSARNKLTRPGVSFRTKHLHEPKEVGLKLTLTLLLSIQAQLSNPTRSLVQDPLGAYH